MRLPQGEGVSPGAQEMGTSMGDCVKDPGLENKESEATGADAQNHNCV